MGIKVDDKVSYFNATIHPDGKHQSFPHISMKIKEFVGSRWRLRMHWWEIWS